MALVNTRDHTKSGWPRQNVSLQECKDLWCTPLSKEKTSISWAQEEEYTTSKQQTEWADRHICHIIGQYEAGGTGQIQQ